MIRYNTDNPEHVRQLLAATPVASVLPRRTVYGSAHGLIPVGEAIPDKLVSPSDYKEVIAHCHAEKIFPMYHQRATWGPDGFRWNQDGLNYCWAWSAAAAMMDLRAREGKPTILLAPVSLGWTVNWRNDGNYLESAIAGLKERGICSADFVPDQHSRNPRDFKAGWEADALGQRLAEAWDTDVRSMLQHSLTILRTGTGLYIAYNWWSHALECVGLKWDESLANNVAWIIRNSHNEDDFIELTGSRGVPDEAYGFRASLT